jgi:glycosyltransferase involved in cell wall biosynthesis
MQNAIVVIPARNEQKTVGTIVLESVKRAANLLVVDDDSADDTLEEGK